ncbi:carnosine N-methyltransferase [Lepeophtheirus salmonis]|nr:carnosine N-methyltransferase-like [Lepeophtheirus salmonis]
MAPESKIERDRRKEKEHFISVLNAFRNYSSDSKVRFEKIRQNMKKSIPQDHQDLLDKHGYSTFLKNAETCVDANAVLIEDIVGDMNSVFENDSGLYSGNDHPKEATSIINIEKVQSVMKMFVRDWSKCGEEERRVCYGKILLELESIYPADTRHDIKVLVPGAGLGRLAYEIAKMGFCSEGNEFSLFMLFASNFILNKCKFVECFQVHPWIHSFCNNYKQEDILRSITFPDEDPNSLQEGAQFSMVAGDFLEVYGRDPSYENHFDSLISCFFLDCAHNILDFIQVIYKVLKPGGTWINFGPLLYHYSEMIGEISIEPSYDIVRSLIEDSGFTFTNEETNVPVSYNQNPKSMLQYKYNCVFFTCIKKEN